MRAVYECKYPAHFLPADEYNPLYKIMEGYDGEPVRVPVWRLPYDGGTDLQFVNGLAELTDPKDIRAMRRYIKARGDDFFTEISFEGSEEELYPKDPEVVPVPEASPQDKYKDTEDEYKSLTEWDKQTISRLRR